MTTWSVKAASFWIFLKSTTNSLGPNKVPRSVNHTWSFPVDFTLSTANCIFSAFRNWAFLIFTIFPVFPASINISVWRHKNAGIWMISTRCPWLAICSGVWKSVVMGRPNSSRMASNMAIPSSIPGPRKLLNDVRLALSKLALKYISTLSSFLIRANSPATSRNSAGLSITQGPAMIVM